MRRSLADDFAFNPSRWFAAGKDLDEVRARHAGIDAVPDLRSSGAPYPPKPRSPVAKAFDGLEVKRIS